MARTITKVELVERVAGMVSKQPQEVRDTVIAVLDAISEHLVEGHRIELRDFGVFSVKVRKPRVGRNPNEPKKSIKIPATPVPVWKPGRLLKQRVSERKP
ncbi:HU family DNA-binding protein [bacterium]|nr:HU family DNA-binding protein [bacterium]